MNITKLKFSAAFVALTMCLGVFLAYGWFTNWEMFANHTNPVAGWQVESLTAESQTIQKDYQQYIQTLPPNEKPFVGPVNFLKDGKGQHAVVIEIALNGTNWDHVLIYDKNDIRIKTVKCIRGHYAC